MNSIIATAETQQSESQSFTDIRAQWKALAADRKITNQDIAALCIYRSMIRGEDKEATIQRLRKSYTPITNTVKLANSASPYWSVRVALYMIRNSSLIEWLTPDEKQALLSIAKAISMSDMGAT